MANLASLIDCLLEDWILSTPDELVVIADDSRIFPLVGLSAGLSSMAPIGGGLVSVSMVFDKQGLLILVAVSSGE